MRPRELATSSPLVEAYGAQNISTSLGQTVGAIMDNPELGGRIASGLRVAGANSTGFTDEQRSDFYAADAQRRSQIDTISRDLAYEFDPVRVEELKSQLDDLYKQADTQRDSMVEESIAAGRMLDVDTLRERYGDIIDIAAPMTEEAAKLMYEGKRQEIIRNAIISAGPKGAAATAVKFGASILNLATDPAEVATMFIPIVGPATKANLAAKLGRVGGAAAVGAIEGGVGSLLTEPLYYAASKSQQLDYSMEDALFNIGAGFFIGGAIGTVGGALARKTPDSKAIAEIIDNDMRTLADERIDLPELSRTTDEQIMAVETKARDQARRMAAALDGKVTFQQALAQLASDQAVQVDLVMPKAMPRPQTLSEFIRSKGGINDQDPMFRGELQSLGIQGRAQYYNSRGTKVNGVSNPMSKNNLDDIAELAHEAGFIPERDTNMLVEYLREEQRGNFAFSSRDASVAEDWRRFNQAVNDYEAEVAHRDAIQAELQAIGYKNATPDEIALISEYMAVNRVSVDAAADRIAVQAEGMRASMQARRSLDPRQDPLADFEAAARAIATPEEIDFDVAMQREMDAIEQLNAEGALTAEQRAQLAQMEEIDAKTDAYIDNIQAAIACIVRN